MAQISINLLPTEVTLVKKSSAQRSLKIKVCIAIICLFIVASLAVISLRIMQSSKVRELNAILQGTESEVSSLKEKEGVATFLKKHLESVHKLSELEPKQYLAFKLIDSLILPNIKVANLTIDRKSKVALSAQTRSSKAMDSFLDSLTNPAQNQGLIGEVNLEGVSKDTAGNLRFDMNIAFK